MTMLPALPAPLQRSHRLRCVRQLPPTPPCISRSSLMLDGPPASYDFRTEVADSTTTIVGGLHPQLQDLVDDGECVVLPEPLILCLPDGTMGRHNMQCCSL